MAFLVTKEGGIQFPEFSFVLANLLLVTEVGGTLKVWSQEVLGTSPSGSCSRLQGSGVSCDGYKDKQLQHGNKPWGTVPHSPPGFCLGSQQMDLSSLVFSKDYILELDVTLRTSRTVLPFGGPDWAELKPHHTLRSEGTGKRCHPRQRTFSSPMPQSRT